MKKTLLFSLGLILAFSSLFVSCSEKEPVYYNVSVNSSEGGKANFLGNYLGISMVVDEGESITVVATPDEGYVFLGWFIGDSETAVSTEATYTVIVMENVSLVAKFKKRVNYNGYEAIDLGLSVKWASCNVGANAPEEYGDYFAWGEISPKRSYSDSNSLTYGKAMSDISGNAQYDAARANWGGNWRMPTRAEQDELRNECTWEWTTLNGVNGYRVTGPNANSIFLPAAGFRYGTSLHCGEAGYYWSSTPRESYIRTYTRYLFFSSNSYGWYNAYRYYGQSVRPVSK